MVQPSPFYALASPLPYEICGTSLHSSRMCTACALTVSPSMPCTGGGLLLGGCLLWGSLLRGGPALGGCLLWRGRGLLRGGGGIPACTEADTLWTESQMPVKTLPCPNFVVGSKNTCDYHVAWFVFIVTLIAITKKQQKSEGS